MLSLSKHLCRLVAMAFNEAVEMLRQAQHDGNEVLVNPEHALGNYFQPIPIMDIKYLSDDKGKITGVFIPIEEWERLQKEYRIAEKAPADSGTKLQQSLREAMKKVKPDDSAEESTEK